MIDMKQYKRAVTISLLTGITLLAGCTENSGVQRWYSQEQVTKGAAIFAANCAGCHGEQAQGVVKDWQSRLADGSLPPPPLNGEAHTWHHPTSLLLEIIQKGGALYDGKMPAFEDRLSLAEQQAVIAWFQSLWSDEIYLNWQEGERDEN